MTQVYRRLRVVVATALLASLSAPAGCSAPPPEPPHEPSQLVPPAARDDDVASPADAPGPTDHWIQTYGAYLTPSQRDAYLRTPPAYRMDRWGALLLDLRLREDLLQQSQDVLSRDDVEAYRRLPDAASARAFVQDKRRKAQERALPDDHMTDGPTPARKKEPE
jgi:hypothetical protein